MPGKKFDQDKPRYDLIDAEYEEALASVLTMGAQKYSPNNWQEVTNFKARYYSAMRRHMKAWRCGEINDPESGLNHMAHIACNAMFLFWRDNNETTDVSRLDGGAAATNQASWRNHSDSDEPNNVEADSAREQLFEEIATVLDLGGSHELAGTCIYDVFARWGIKVIPGPDNSPSNE